MAKDLKSALGPAPVFTGLDGFTAIEVDRHERLGWVMLKTFIDSEGSDKGKNIMAAVGLSILQEKWKDPLDPALTSPATTWYENAVGLDPPTKALVDRLHASW